MTTFLSKEEWQWFALQMRAVVHRLEGIQARMQNPICMYHPLVQPGKLIIVGDGDITYGPFPAKR